MAIIPQSIVASNLLLLWLTVNSRCSLGFFFIASHIHFFTLSMSLHSQVPLILPLLPAYLGSFKLVGNYYILYNFNWLSFYKYYFFTSIIFFSIGKYQKCEQMWKAEDEEHIFL